MGVVYRATDLALERPVALKLIAPELAADEGFRKRFLKESRLAASLDHPHVLPVFAAGEAGRTAVPGHALRRGRGPEDAPAAGGQALARARTAHLRPGRRSARCRPSPRSRAPRREARERAPGRVGAGLPGRLRADQAGRGGLDGDGPARRHPRLPRPRADPRRRGRRAHGRVRARLRPVRVPRGAGAFPPLDGSRASVGAHAGAAPALAAYPSLEPILARALAKEKKDRYESPAVFCEAAAQALGLETPRLRRRRRLLRRSRLLVAAGVLMLAGAAVAVGVEVTTRTSSPTPVGNAVAAVEADGGRVSSYTATGTTPSNVVVGGGSVWVLNADDRTISRIDQETRRIVKTFATGGLPTDLAFAERIALGGERHGDDPRSPRGCGLHVERRQDRPGQRTSLPPPSRFPGTAARRHSEEAHRSASLRPTAEACGRSTPT